MRTFAPILVLCAACGGADEHIPIVDARPPTDAAVDADEGGDGCGSEALCPPPESGKATICGRIWDVETDQPIRESTVNVEMQCDPNNPRADGPCSLSIRFVDATNHSMVLAPEGGVYTDDCNRFRARNIPAPPSGVIAILTDDATGTTDRHRMTVVNVPVALANPAPGTRAYVTRTTTDVAWSTPAFGSGATFADRGVLALTFAYQLAPRMNVQARRDGTLIPADDYYFTDMGIARTSLSTSLTATGANGTALIVNSSTRIAHDGTGGEPSTCQWPSAVVGSVPGVVTIHRIDAETATGLPCP